MEISATTTTVDIKCGRQVTVCAIRRYRWFPILFSINAKRIGTGKPASRLQKLIASVLVSTFVNIGDLKKKSNHFVPAHGLPVTPLDIVKFRNAIWIPYIGQQQKMIIQAKAGRTKIYKAIFRFTNLAVLLTAILFTLLTHLSHQIRQYACDTGVLL